MTRVPIRSPVGPVTSSRTTHDRPFPSTPVTIWRTGRVSHARRRRRRGRGERSTVHADTVTCVTPQDLFPTDGSRPTLRDILADQAAWEDRLRRGDQYAAAALIEALVSATDLEPPTIAHVAKLVRWLSPSVQERVVALWPALSRIQGVRQPTD